MRNMSFALTTRQIIERTKGCTRRTGWRDLEVHELLCAIEKGQGLKKGEHVRRLCIIDPFDVRLEPPRLMLDDLAYGAAEVILEGFPDWTPERFVDFLCRANKITPDTLVTRIEFSYVDALGKDAA